MDLAWKSGALDQWLEEKVADEQRRINDGDTGGN
jgi:hypothetical protein